jgi:hypothetical protein
VVEGLDRVLLGSQQDDRRARFGDGLTLSITAPTHPVRTRYAADLVAGTQP